MIQRRDEEARANVPTSSMMRARMIQKRLPNEVIAIAIASIASKKKRRKKGGGKEKYRYDSSRCERDRYDV